MMKIEVSVPGRTFIAELPESSHWQDALEVFLDALRAMSYYPPTLSELSGDDIIESLSKKVEELEATLEKVRECVSPPS